MTTDAPRPAQPVPVRAVSLVPSITETLRAWGLDPVACTRYCEQPDLVTVGGTKNPDIDAIVALHPDVVLVDKVENRKEDADELTDLGLRVVALDVDDLDGLDADLSRLAEAVNLAPPAPMSIDVVRDGIRCSAFIPIWRRPWMTISGATYGSRLLERIGVSNVFAESEDPFPTVELADVAQRGPDLILVPSEPYEFKPDHLTELRDIAPVVEVDGQDLFWWGARTPAAARRLQTVIAAVVN